MDFSNIDDIFKLLGYRYFFNFRDYTILYTNDQVMIDNPELAEISEEEFRSFLDLRNQGYTFKRGANGEVIPIEPLELLPAVEIPTALPVKPPVSLIPEDPSNVG